jgi:hypothetical protein
MKTKNKLVGVKFASNFFLDLKLLLLVRSNRYYAFILFLGKYQFLMVPITILSIKCMGFALEAILQSFMILAESPVVEELQRQLAWYSNLLSELQKQGEMVKQEVPVG